MSAVGRVTGLAGLVAVVAGVALLVSPSAAAEAAAAVAPVGNAYLVAAAIGFVALMAGFGRWLTWSVQGVSEASMPAVESYQPTPHPGAELDEAVPELAGRRGRAVRPVDHADEIRERLRADAVETLVVRAGLDREAARERVEAGTWTDDRFAARYLGGEDAPRPRPHERLLAWLRREEPIERDVRHAVDAIETAAEEGLS